MSDQPCAVPLIEQLRSVPVNVCASVETHWMEDGTPVGHSHIPAGHMMHDAADRIEALEAELAEAQRDAGRFRWIAAHVYSTGHTSGPNMDPITHWGFDAPDDEFWASIDAAMAKARGA